MTHHRNTWITFVAVTAAACITVGWTGSVALAQGGPKGPGMPHGGPFGDLNEQGVKELVQTVMLVRLTKELDLDTERTVVLVRQFEDAKEKSAALAEERKQIMQDLQQAVENKAPDEQINEKINALIAADQKMQEIKLDAFKEASEGLTPTQKAKLYTFIHQFEDQMRKLVMRAKMRAGTAGMMTPDERGPGMRGMVSPESRGPGMRGMMAPEGQGPGMRGIARPGDRNRDDVRPPAEGKRGFRGMADQRREGRSGMRGTAHETGSQKENEPDPPAGE